jgi:hypothetical protein
MGGLSNPGEQNQVKNNYKGVIFIGKVVDNKDPKKWKRIKISIAEVIEGGTDELPWAIPLTSDFDHVNVPDEGKLLYCILQNGDKHYPMYYAETTSNNNEIPDILKPNYPDRDGMRDRKNNYWYIDKKTDDIEFFQFNGNKMHLYKNGDIDITCVKDVTIKVTGNVSLTVGGNVDATVAGTASVHSDGNMDITSSTHISIDAPSVSIN